MLGVSGCVQRHVRRLGVCGGFQRRLRILGFSGGVQRGVRILECSGGFQKRVGILGVSGGVQRRVRNSRVSGGVQRRVRKVRVSGGFQRRVQLMNVTSHCTMIVTRILSLCLLLAACSNMGQSLLVTHIADVSNGSNHVINATVPYFLNAKEKRPEHHLSEHVELTAKDCLFMDGPMEFVNRSGSLSLHSANVTETFDFLCSFALSVPKSTIVKVQLECVGLLCGVLPHDSSYVGYFLRHEHTYGIAPGKVTLFHTGSVTVSIERRVRFFQGTPAPCFPRQCRLQCIDRTKYVIGEDNRRSCLSRPFRANFSFTTYQSHTEDGFEVHYTSATQGTGRTMCGNLVFDYTFFPYSQRG